MAAVEGFMKGFTWGQNISQQRENHEFIQEERKRMQLDRDADKFIRAYNAVRGGRDASEFSESGDLEQLVFQYRDNRFVEDLVNDGMVPGKKAKLRSIGVEEKTGLRAFMVDTFDDKGNAVSRNRPITLGRRSREDGPGDTPLLLTGGDFHNYMVAEMGQYKGFQDRWGGAERAADTSARLYQALFGDPDQQAKVIDEQFADAEAKVEKLPKEAVELKEDIERAGMTMEEATEAGPEQLPEIRDDNDLVGLNNRIDALNLRRRDLQAAVSERYNGINFRPEPGEKREDFQKRLEAAQASDPEFQQMKEENNELRDLKVKQRELRDMVKADPTGEVAQAVKENFLEDQTKGAAMLLSRPDIMGASKSDKQAIGNGQRRGEAQARKPVTQVQARAILNQKRKIADKFISGQRQSKKDFENYVRALQVQASRGEISTAEMSNQIVGFMKLKAAQAKDKGKIKTTTQNGRIVWWKEDTGDIIHTMDIPKQSSADGDDDESYLTTMGKYINLLYPDKDDPRRAGALAAIDQSVNVMDYGLDQKGALAFNTRALQYRQAAINDAADWNPFISQDDAEQMYSSLTPFYSALQLGVPTDEAQDFTERVAHAWGDENVPEAVWRHITKAAFELTRDGSMTHEKAQEQVLQQLRAFRQQQGG